MSHFCCVIHKGGASFRAPIKCGQTVRLMHLSTRRNLHSHHFQSPLSHNLEVSAFGEDGEGDEGMDVMCVWCLCVYGGCLCVCVVCVCVRQTLRVKVSHRIVCISSKYNRVFPLYC